MNKTAEQLRKERLSRLNKKASAPVAKPVAKKAETQVAAPVAPKVQAHPSEVQEVLTASVVDIGSIEKGAVFGADLYGAEGQNPHWLITANGRPLGEIQFADSPHPIEKSMFTSDTYGQSVVHTLGAEGPANVFASLKGRIYQAAVARSAAVDTIRKEVQGQADTAVRVARAELRDRLMNVVGLVLTAQHKNFIQDNGLKDSLFTHMTTVGLPESTAVSVIENAWQKSAKAYVEETLKKAEAWMDLPVDAYKALAEQIDDMPTVAIAPVAVEASVDVPSSAHNIPSVHTAHVASPVSSTPDYRSLFGF